MFWSQHLGCWDQNTSRIQNKTVYATLCLTYLQHYDPAAMLAEYYHNPNRSDDRRTGEDYGSSDGSAMGDVSFNGRFRRKRSHMLPKVSATLFKKTQKLKKDESKSKAQQAPPGARVGARAGARAGARVGARVTMLDGHESSTSSTSTSTSTSDGNNSDDSDDSTGTFDAAFAQTAHGQSDVTQWSINCTRSLDILVTPFAVQGTAPFPRFLFLFFLFFTTFPFI